MGSVGRLGRQAVSDLLAGQLHKAAITPPPGWPLRFFFGSTGCSLSPTVKWTLRGGLLGQRGCGGEDDVVDVIGGIDVLVVSQT